MSREIKCEEVIQHNNKDGLWMVIRDDVYDVTAFLEEHPGGEDTLLEAAGTDATQAFDDVGHSDDAKELLKKYKIGSLPQGEKMPDSISEKNMSDLARGSRSPSRQTRPEIKKHDCLNRERERPPRRLPCDRYFHRSPPPDSPRAKWKYILAIAGVVVVAFALKKYYTAA